MNGHLPWRALAVTFGRLHLKAIRRSVYGGRRKVDASETGHKAYVVAGKTLRRVEKGAVMTTAPFCRG